MVVDKTLVFFGVVAVVVIAVAALLTQGAPAAAATMGEIELKINSGSLFTSTPTVMLSLSAPGANECRYSNDGVAWTDYAPPQEFSSWALSADDGRKAVQVQCKSGSETKRAQATITLDSTKPEIVLISPQNGSVVSTSFTLSFSVSDRQSSNFYCQGNLDNLQKYSGDVRDGYQFTVLASSGAHTVRVACTDEAGNQAVATASFQVQSPQPSPSPQATVQPYALRISINGGDDATISGFVVLNLQAIGAETCRYSNDGVVYSAWENYVTLKSWNLSPGVGVRTVYYRCVNGYGQSTVVSDSIEVIAPGQATTIPMPSPGAPPYGLVVQINSNAAYTNSKNVILFLAATGADECRYSNDGIAYSSWEAFAAEKDWTLAEGDDGAKVAYYQCKNGYASSTIAQDDILLDTTPPSKINDLHLGDISVQKGTVDLDWSDSTDELSGVKDYKVYRNDNTVSRFDLVGTTAISFFTDHPPDVMGPWYYYVVPYDNAGNVGEHSNIVLLQVQ